MSERGTSSKNESDTEAEPRGADEPGKPDSPADLTKPSWVYLARRTLREFSKDECTTLAAALTYYAVLALFPAMIAALSLVSLFARSAKAVDTLTGILAGAGASSVAGFLRPTLEQLSQSQGAGVALSAGLLGGLWSASASVGAVGRSMNRMYEVDEGRPVWKRRPFQLAVTCLLIILAAVAMLALIVSGPLVESIGSALGLGSAAILAWRVLKWPLLVVVVVAIIAILYHLTPNVKQPKFRWISIGAFVAFVVWALLSVAFGLYVSNFSNYNKTYGSLAGVIIFMLWLWLTNLALLFGAELDSELERARQLQAGIKAEESLQLLVRDTRNIDKAQTKHEQDVERGRKLRQSRGQVNGDLGIDSGNRGGDGAGSNYHQGDERATGRPQGTCEGADQHGTQVH